MFGLQSEIIARLRSTEFFNELDLQVGAYLCYKVQKILEFSEQDLSLLALSAAVANNFTSRGHVCFDLAQGWQLQTLQDQGFEVPEADRWRQYLLDLPVVGHGGQFRPLILSGSKLYLQRYFEYETIVANKLKALSKGQCPLDLDRLQNDMGHFFEPGPELDWQQVAAFTALQKKLCIISGGPGTGKTTTVSKILALVLGQNENLRLAMTAPTGKAAARLTESLHGAMQNLGLSRTQQKLLPQGQTVHRLLGARGESNFKFNSDNFLPLDLLIVDEASMLDLPLMAALLRALPDNIRLILLGDHNQLASVESGAMLGDICATAKLEIFSQDFCQKYQQICGQKLSPTPTPALLQDNLVRLEKSYRFSADSGIFKLSQAVSSSQQTKLDAILKREFNDLGWLEVVDSSQAQQRIKQISLQNFAPYLAATSPTEAFKFWNQFKILCALRCGESGVEKLNQIIPFWLQEKGLLKVTGNYYQGRPILITQNDYINNLSNGDIGLILKDERGKLKACFADGRNKFRFISPLRLPEHETCFAMTVHKSQGSEFEHVLFVLPQNQSPLLTRELLYTAITRAKQHISIVGSKNNFLWAMQRKVQRMSGLKNRLKNFG